MALPPVTWLSSSGAVATVADGLVTGVDVGQASMWAAAAGRSASVGVTVTRPPAVLTSLSVTLPPTLPVGTAVAATVVAREPFGASMPTGTLSWASSAPAVASVSEAGVVTGLAQGAATIVATAGAFASDAALAITPISFGNGTRTVPGQVPPGRYRSVNAAAVSCYWERLSGFGGSSEEIIANDVGGGSCDVDVLPTDVAIRVRGCQPFSSGRGPATPTTTSPFRVGVYLVGLDVAPGTWRADAPASTWYWARLRTFAGGTREIIANDFGATPAIVTIAETQVGFETNGWGRGP